MKKVAIINDPRKKKITPILPSRVMSTGLVEDSDDSGLLYKNLTKDGEYWTYNRDTKEILVMSIPDDTNESPRVLRTIRDIDLRKWKELCSTMEAVNDNSEYERFLGESTKLLEDYRKTGVTTDYSDIYTGKYGHRFYYNYDMNRLEHLDGTYTVGISRPDWEDNPTYWVNAADKEVEMDSVYS